MSVRRFTPAPGQTADSVAADLERARLFEEQMRASGISGNVWMRRVGPIKIGAYAFKQVGPPEWRYPKLLASAARSGVLLGIGWRLTAYSVGVVIRPGRTTVTEHDPAGAS